MRDDFPVSSCVDPPRAYGDPPGAGVIRAEPEDFFVSEEAVCTPDGGGEHVWLRVRKRNTNTEWVARQLARIADVSLRQVSYAGLKDRRAVTEQWFSVHLPGRATPDWSGLNSNEIQVIASARHPRKLRRGALKRNHFRIRVTGFAGDRDATERRLAMIAGGGFPNYFGSQRFGHDGGNLRAAGEMFAHRKRRYPRHKRSLWLSAARSMLFNAVLAERVRNGSWNSRLAGDVMQLDGRRALFPVEADDTDIDARVNSLDIHPTGPLWGRGPLAVRDECLVLEEQVLAPLELWRRGLEQAGLEQERRALRVRAENLIWSFPENGVLDLEFSLQPGSYATVMLREVCCAQSVGQ